MAMSGAPEELDYSAQYELLESNHMCLNDPTVKSNVEKPFRMFDTFHK